MKTVTVKQCENGFVVECDDEIYVAAQIDDGYDYRKPSLTQVLRDIFEPPVESPKKEVTDLKVVA